MALNITALALTAGISILVPLIIVGIIWFKNKSERKGILILFLTGVAIYIAMEKGIKENLLVFLFNHTSFFGEFMSKQYITYLLLVAFLSAVFTVLPEFYVIRYACKKQMSFPKVVVFSLGYAMTEAVLLVGYKSILTIIELVKDSSQKLGVSTTELFLSGYERILIIIIRVSLVAALVYFIQQNKSAFAVVLKVVCHTLVSFLPGFFIAFSMVNYFEVYDRSVALMLVYIVLTVAAFTAGVVLNSLKYSFKDEG